MSDANQPGLRPQPSSRREARALEARATGSAEKRIRKVQKSYSKPPKRGRAQVVVPTRPTTKSPSRARTIGSKVLSLAAMVFVGALAIGMSVPANAFGPLPTDQLLAGVTTGSTSVERADGQSVEVSSTAASSSAARDAFTVTSWAEMLRLKYGTRDYNYSLGDPNGPIRWPFPYAVPISSGYGERAAPCYGCSTIHMGIDFNPGVGAPIYAIAAGVVKQAEDGNGGYGNFVYIDHGNLLGDGQNITSLYAHMQHGSVALRVGDTVQVGDFIGTVGQTGQATGPHLHFELLISGAQVDGFAWLRANA
jgi:murein DD-endopeptidase MepM/ murein hydrolase activator NlpD